MIEQNRFKKFVAITTVFTHLSTQVVFAGAPTLAPALLTPPFVKNYLSLLTNKIVKAGLVIFHAYPYSNMIDPRGRTDLPEEGQRPPERMDKEDEKQMSILRQLEELQIFQQDQFKDRPQLPGSQPDILDTISTYKLNVNIAREFAKVNEERQKSAKEIEQDIMELRAAIRGAGGSVSTDTMARSGSTCTVFSSGCAIKNLERK